MVVSLVESPLMVVVEEANCSLMASEETVRAFTVATRSSRVVGTSVFLAALGGMIMFTV